MGDQELATSGQICLFGSMQKVARYGDLGVSSLAFSPYTLFPRSALNSRASNQPRKGALIRLTVPVEQGGLKRGYGDCFPWPELGDAPLEEQLRLLQQGTLTPLTERSLQFAQWDAEARSQGIHLLDSQTIPPSHFLMTDLNQLNSTEVEAIIGQGFRRIKLKVGKDPYREAETIRGMAPLLSKPDLKLRLDFNHSGSPDLLVGFLHALGPSVAQIDWIEDPFPYSAELWCKLQRQGRVRLALDRIDPADYASLVPGSFSVLVIKPAIQDWKKGVDLAHRMGTSICITSYLDHPLGQTCAAWVGSQVQGDLRAVPVESCGFLSQNAYLPTPFSKILDSAGPDFSSPPGTGFGFDDLLLDLPWFETIS